MSRRGAALSLSLPAGSRVRVGRFDGAEHLVLSFPTAAVSLPDDLTEAERSIAYLIVAGLSNQDIARARDRSVNTVTKQVTAVLRKVGVQSRMELVARVKRTPP